jgi:ectoine hydroxylase-related dioxygenase (phytanoyl-CoA dioxygenase family)
MQGFDRHSAFTAELLDDPRFRSIGDLPGDGHVFGEKRADNRIEALIKPIGVVEGISDVPWHKDCSLGRHSYECCGMTVGISVTGADAASGQLRVVAGSHRALVWPAFVRRNAELPLVDLPTRTGDVTLHLSCTTHMAQPPVERERRVLYTGFSLPVHDRAAANAARQRLREVREAAPVTVSQRPGHTGA